MSVLLGKILWSLFNPGSILFGLLVAALLLSWWSVTRRWGRRLGMAVLAVIGILGILPVADWAIRPLEEYYPVPELPAQVDGIIVLAGTEQPSISNARQQFQTSDGDRLIHFVALARRYPQARLLFGGGGLRQRETDPTEATVAREALLAMGFDISRIRFEDRSRNTIENAVYGRDMMQPQPGETWLLVTSASHMPRAVNCFLSVGWTVLPYPVDYQTGYPAGFGFRPLGTLAGLNWIVREWAGLAGYWLMGRTQDLLPPRSLAPAG
ncbi:YdcF family protein [Ferrovibrio sp.]|uniref:YdcF family protein n=1 Tax=Ferrovibrio sp. TaxID=1917215 RepID=UPI00311F2E32